MNLEMSIVTLALLPAPDVPIIHCSESGLERPAPPIVKLLTPQYKHTQKKKKKSTHTLKGYRSNE